MTLRSFLDCAYVLLINEYQRLGMNLMDAIDENVTWQAGGEGGEKDIAARRADHQSDDRITARRNDQAMQQLQAMMGGAFPG